MPSIRSRHLYIFSPPLLVPFKFHRYFCHVSTPSPPLLVPFKYPQSTVICAMSVPSVHRYLCHVSTLSPPLLVPCQYPQSIVTCAMSVPSVHRYLCHLNALNSLVLGSRCNLNAYAWYPFCFFVWRCDPMQAMASLFLTFLDHTQRRITIGRSPLDGWSPRRRDLYLTTRDTRNKLLPPPRNSNPRPQQASGRRLWTPGLLTLFKYPQSTGSSYISIFYGYMCHVNTFSTQLLVAYKYPQSTVTCAI